VAAKHGRKTGSLSYVFCSDDKILEINRQFLQHDYFTDIITFDYSSGNIINGDIIISIDTVKSNAEKYGKQFGDELNRVLVHGILHLCGQNDKTAAEAAQMREMEDEALKNMRQEA
jgi:rRNA maturation RNase YbeY